MIKEYKFTPWGHPDQLEIIADGITLYMTPSHGGFKISEARRKAMPEPYRSIETFAGGNWYEEDCDWCLLVLSFPEEFIFKYGEGVISEAENTYNNYHKGDQCE
jgi:hypothetical protein